MTVAASASATVESRGPDGYHSSLTVTLTPATAIPGPVSSHTTPGGG